MSRAERAALLLGCALVCAMAGPEGAAASCDLSAPAEQGVVLRYDLVAAGEARAAPLLELHGDGTLRYRDSDGVHQDRLGAKALAGLWQEITEAGDFAAIDGATLTAAVPAGQGLSLGADGRLPLVIADAPTSYLELTGAHCSHAVSVYALAASAAHADGDAGLQTLHEIENILQALLARLRG